MQVFLPYADYKASLLTLDKKRLFKQVVECGQLINGILGISSLKTRSHPASRMFKDNINSLIEYHNIAYDVCVEKYGIKFVKTKKLAYIEDKTMDKPSWIGREDIHSRMRARLLDKDMKFYSQYGWAEQPVDATIGYIWPVPLLSKG